MSIDEDNAFRQVVADYYQALYRFARSLARNPEDAADLTQQTFVIYAKNRHSIRQQNRVRSWLFTTLYREFLRLRRNRSHFAGVDPEVIDAAADPSTLSPARSADAQALLKAMDGLEESYRAPLALFYLEDLSYKDIAEILGVPVGTVMSRLSRAKQQLRTLMEQ